MAVAANEPDLSAYPVQPVVGQVGFDEVEVVGEDRHVEVRGAELGVDQVVDGLDVVVPPGVPGSGVEVWIQVVAAADVERDVRRAPQQVGGPATSGSSPFASK